MASLYDEPPTGADRLIGPDGAWGRFIDQANDDKPRHSGCDDDASLVLTPLTVTGRLLIGHTTDLANKRTPVWVEEQAIVQPGAARTVGGRCRSCMARTVIGRFDDDTLMIIEHQAACTWLVSMLRSNGIMR